MHKHPEIEQTFVLEGSFYDHDGIAVPANLSGDESGRSTKPVRTKVRSSSLSTGSRTSSSTAPDTLVSKIIGPAKYQD
jgi:hypothetical protein